LGTVAIEGSLDVNGDRVAKSLDGLITLVKDDLEQVNKTIVDHMHSPIALIPQLAGHIIAAGGKRLRPVLTLASAKLVGYEGDRHVKLAAVIELLHTATLLHDDVVDESELRRGRASANALFGNQPSVLVGDFLFSRSFELMVEDGSLSVLAILSRASAVIAEGEVLQLITANDTETTVESYLQVICSKTAALFAAACRIGAVVADRPKAEEDALAAYGLSLGIAFQLIDDALDYSAREAELGKTVGDDFREGKITLPVIHAFHAGDDEEKAFWRRCLEKLEQEDGDLEHANALLAKHGSVEVTISHARQYGEDARAALSIFPDCAARQAMLDVIDFCIERAY
jgi:octaprenyl-diphosphate synthase